MTGAAVAASRWLMAAGLVLAMASGPSALGSFRVGIWTTSETMGLVLHAGALLCALGLLSAARRDAPAMLGLIRAPVVAVPLLLAGWSAAVAPAAEYPWLAIFGAPQTSEGALLYLDMALWSAATLLVRDDPKVARMLAWIAGILAIGMPLAFLNPAMRIYFYPDWMAFYGLFAPTIVAVMLGTAWTPRLRWAGIALAALAPLLLSQNLSAIIGGLAIVPALLGAAALARRRPSIDRRFVPALATAAALVPLAGLAAIWGLGTAGVLATLWSRLLAAKVALAAFADHPLRWLTGQGWGHDVLTLLRRLDAVGQAGLDQSWDLAQRDYFHSHHAVLEGLIGAGLPGALLTAALPVAVILGADRRWRGLAGAMALAFALTACLWFQTPATMAWQAVAFAAVARRPSAASGRPAPLARVAAMAAPAAAAALLIGALGFLLPFGIAARDAVVATDVRRDSPPPSACADFPAEGWRGHLGLARLYGSNIYGAQGEAARAGWTGNLTDRLAALVCLAEARSDRRPDVYLLFWGLDLRGRLALMPAFAPLRQRFAPLLANWEDRLGGFLEQAPGRGDVAIAYLGWALATGQQPAVLALGNRMLSRQPDNAVALWFTGAAMLADPEDRTARLGAVRMQRALTLGIENWVPVEPSMVEKVRAAAAAGR